MKFFFKRDKSRSKKGETAVENGKANDKVKGDVVATPGEAPPPVPSNGVNTEPLEEVAHLPFSDIIAISCEFRQALRAYTNFTSKKRVVAVLKSITSQMMQRNFALKSVDQEAAKVGIVKRIMKEPLPVRARLALAVQHFCLVVEQEMENDELEQGTGLLAALRGANGFPPSLLPSGSEKKKDVVSKISLVADFDVARIYHQLMTTDKLPSLEEMAELLRRTTCMLREEANVVMVHLPCVVVGDIHGQKRDLVESVIAAGGPLGVDDGSENSAGDTAARAGQRDYLFLGDYVDRGPQSFHCLALLFAAKLLSPKHVFLLRGNHESSETNRRYGFLNECYEHFPLSVDADDGGGSDCGSANDSGEVEWDLKEHPLWVLANEAFDSLPLCAVINGERDGKKIRVCAMHGGLSPFISDSLDGILAIDRYRSVENGPLADITWADPIVGATSDENSPELEEEGGGGVSSSSGNSNVTAATAEAAASESAAASDAVAANDRHHLMRHCVSFDYCEPLPAASAAVGYVYSARGRGHNFGEDVTLRFLRDNDLSFIVRAHQCVDKGFQWSHQRRVLTVFSAPNYCGLGNKGAILILHDNGEPEIVQFEACESNAAANAAPLPVPPKDF
ncbi:putative serine/threonine protein phosphatase [Trypanosoma grayi]|uniref:putative serine/threonine protein phosphatase n=1 Tax=Trypanosoma grayi TaxID=71804 RepID=UPI0004F40EFA|nr:putative serine/threonine protein phosphatase [Trypanosoma grayi]KEG09766.1 putative serine/threonine protein phosphatase [Trypanosoma grayi]